MDELIARMRAAVRRTTPVADEPLIRCGDLQIDLANRVATVDGDDVRLTPTEWHLVEILVRNRGKLLTQRELLQEVWGPHYEVETNYLRVYMARIRSKLDPARTGRFITEPGIGYRFNAAVDK